jgi:GrpB-like predicted nucleotidyltransferase (UPF0157 family)
VAGPKPLAGPIVLDDYDPEWARLFEREARKIRAALGDAALRLEHVGSTAVPGLAAKPIVDIVLVVADSAEEDVYVPALQAEGYVLQIREPDWFEHRMLRSEEPSVNLHVFAQGCEEVERMLLFRDRLRADAPDRELYERTKRELAKQRWTFGQDYADAKTAVVAEIVARASRGGTP